MMAMTLEPCPFCGVPAAKNKNPGDRWVYFCPKGHTGYLRHSEWQARAKFAPDWAGYRQGIADGKAEVLPHRAKVVDVTDAEIAEWAERYDLSFGGSKTDARDAFDDAESHHLTRAIGTTQDGSPKARPLREYHEDHGYVTWFAWDVARGEWMGEPAWIGTPNDDDWPGYHTHWLPHPTFPTRPTDGEG